MMTPYMFCASQCAIRYIDQRNKLPRCRSSAGDVPVVFNLVGHNGTVRTQKGWSRNTKRAPSATFVWRSLKSTLILLRQVKIGFEIAPGFNRELVRPVEHAAKPLCGATLFT